MRLTEPTFFILAIVGVLAFFVVFALDFTPFSRQVPLVVGVPALFFALVQLLIELFPGIARRYRRLEQTSVLDVEIEVTEEKLSSSSIETEVEGTHGARIRELDALLWLASLVGAMYVLGFSLAMPLFMLLFLKFEASRGWLFSIGVACGIWAGIYLFFVVLLELPLYEGLLFD